MGVSPASELRGYEPYDASQHPAPERAAAELFAAIHRTMTIFVRRFRPSERYGRRLTNRSNAATTVL
jgi:hypothetical protein